jgi:hypothetical protein
MPPHAHGYNHSSIQSALTACQLLVTAYIGIQSAMHNVFAGPHEGKEAGWKSIFLSAYTTLSIGRFQGMEQ